MDSPENSFIDKLKQGDVKAFEHLFRTNYKLLCNFAFKILKNDTLAEEIVQDIFYHLWKKRQTLDNVNSLSSYLYKSVYNNSLKYIRHQKIVNEHQLDVQFNLSQTFDFQENYSEISEIRNIIEKTLCSVPVRTRVIFQLNRNQGLTYKEIAERLNISVKTVEAGMTSLLKLFRKNLRDYMFIIIIYLFLG